MRWKVIFLFLLVVMAVLFWFYPAEVRQTGQKLASRLNSFWNDKEIKIVGLGALREESLGLDSLRRQSVLWWHINLNQVRAQLAQNPMIEKAEVDRCGGLRWGCFSIRIGERQPALLALVADKLWLVGSDGGFMFPMSPQVIEENSWPLRYETLGRPPFIRKLGGEALAPDILKARLAYARRAIIEIEREVNLKVESVEVKPNGEADVRFHSLALTATFGAAYQEVQGLQEEARRLRVILDKFKENPGILRQVDLAFNKQAVVRFFQ